MARVRFEVMEGELLPFLPVYWSSEYSFNIDNYHAGQDIGYDRFGQSSILFADLEIEIDLQSDRVMFVSGYHPNLYWRESEISPIGMMAGSIHVVADPPLEFAVCDRIVEHDEIVTYYDVRSGWVCITRGFPNVDEEIWEFTKDTALGLNDGELQSVWVKPIFSH